MKEQIDMIFAFIWENVCKMERKSWGKQVLEMLYLEYTEKRALKRVTYMIK